MTNTVAGVHLGPDTHANRPAATAVTAGSLYSCSDHDLIYRSDGATWSTWATLGAGTVAASAVTFTPDGSIAATDVQAAIVEVRDEAAAGSGITATDYPEFYLPANGTLVDTSGAATGTGVSASVSNGLSIVTFTDNSHQYWDVTQALGTGDFDLRARITAVQTVTSASAHPYGGLCVMDASRTAATRVIVANTIPGGTTTAPNVRTIVNASFVGGLSYFGSTRFPQLHRISRSGTTVTTWVSYSEGRNWTTLHTLTDSTDFQKVGFNAHNNTGGSAVFFVDWIRVV